MTNLTLTDVRRIAAEVCRTVVAPHASGTDHEAVFPATTIKALGESGLLGLMVPEASGGVGLGINELTAASEEVASACPATALIMLAHGAACSAIAAGGSSALRARLLPELATGARLAGFAIHEQSSGCMAAPIASRAESAGEGFVLTGSKPFVTAARHLDVAVVLANLDNNRPSLFAVETSLPGVTRGKPEAALGLRGAAVAELALDHCAIGPEALLGEGGDGLKLLRNTIGTVARFGIAGAALGIARAVRATVAVHARARVTGGLSLAERPAVMAAIANLAATVDAMAALLSRNAEQAARDMEQAPLLAMKSKLHTTEQAVQVALAGLQLTGGQGYFGATGIERLFRDSIGFTVHLGPATLLREDVGRAELVP